MATMYACEMQMVVMCIYGEKCVVFVVYINFQMYHTYVVIPATSLTNHLANDMKLITWQMT